MAAKSSAAEDRKAVSRLLHKLFFPKKFRLRKRVEYKKLFRSSKRRAGKWISIDFRIGRNPFPRLGITAPTKFGKAVERNRFKRITREAFRKIRPRLKKGIEINVYPRSAAKNAGSEDIYQELITLLKAYETQS